MLQLTPLEETWAGIELITKGKTNLLRLQLREKFGIDDAEISADLSRLSSRELDSVAKAILTAVSYDQIEWLIDAILSNRSQSES